MGRPRKNKTDQGQMSLFEDDLSAKSVVLKSEYIADIAAMAAEITKAQDALLKAEDKMQDDINYARLQGILDVEAYELKNAASDAIIAAAVAMSRLTAELRREADELTVKPADDITRDVILHSADVVADYYEDYVIGLPLGDPDFAYFKQSETDPFQHFLDD